MLDMRFFDVTRLLHSALILQCLVLIGCNSGQTAPRVSETELSLAVEAQLEKRKPDLQRQLEAQIDRRYGQEIQRLKTEIKELKSSVSLELRVKKRKQTLQSVRDGIVPIQNAYPIGDTLPEFTIDEKHHPLYEKLSKCVNLFTEFAHTSENQPDFKPFFNLDSGPPASPRWFAPLKKTVIEYEKHVDKYSVALKFFSHALDPENFANFDIVTLKKREDELKAFKSIIQLAFFRIVSVDLTSDPTKAAQQRLHALATSKLMSAIEQTVDTLERHAREVKLEPKNNDHYQTLIDSTRQYAPITLSSSGGVEGGESSHGLWYDKINDFLLVAFDLDEHFFPARLDISRLSEVKDIDEELRLFFASIPDKLKKRNNSELQKLQPKKEAFFTRPETFYYSPGFRVANDGRYFAIYAKQISGDPEKFTGNNWAEVKFEIDQIWEVDKNGKLLGEKPIWKSSQSQ